jgi:Fe2+ transport system protein FeoA
MLDVRRSRLGRLAEAILNNRSNRQPSMKGGLTLSDVPPGYRAKVVGFGEKISPARRAHLQAFGLVKDDWVQVVQHSPVTVIQVDQTELALENTLANEIEVRYIRKGEVHEDR